MVMPLVLGIILVVASIVVLAIYPFFLSEPEIKGSTEPVEFDYKLLIVPMISTAMLLIGLIIIALQINNRLDKKNVIKR